MAPSIGIEKISEEYNDYILTSGFLVTFTNYLEYLKSTHRRQFFERIVTISDGIFAKLKIFPTGVTKKFDGFISIYLKARWLQSKSIAIKFDTAVLDGNLKRIYLNSSENFEKVSRDTLIGDPEVMHSDLCFDRKHKFLNEGRIVIQLNISVNIAMMIHPDMLDRFEFEYRNQEANVKKLLEDPSFGDVVLEAGGKRYYAERHILLRGNPMFIKLFQEERDVNGCYTVKDLDSSVLEHILIDCYLNGTDDGEELKRNFQFYRCKRSKLRDW